MTSKWRFWLLGIVIFASFAILVVRLLNLQVRPDEEYGAIAESTMTKTITERGARGQILDANGAALAYDKQIYNIQFYRDPSSKSAQNMVYSKSIWEAIKLIEREGKEVKFDFWMAQDEDGVFRFDTKTENEGVAAAREEMFRSNFYVKSLAEEDIFEKLCENYGIHKIVDETDEDIPESEWLTLEDKVKILSVWQEMQMNAFNSTPITLARDVKWSTVMEIETRQITLDGITVSVENQRVYPKGTLACHILGYVGKMQTQTQLDNYVTQLGYQRDDQIGLDGVEKSMEEWLTGNSGQRRGKSVYEVDRSGRKIRLLSQEDPQDGNTVKLTIDSGLQQKVEEELDFIVNKIRDAEEKKLNDGRWLEANREALEEYDGKDQDIKFAENGAIVVLDMQARVKAMASYPNYDPNLFVMEKMTEEQWLRLMDDKRNPLFNNAIKARSIPGSVFKMVTALAGLVDGKLTVTETITDEGRFSEYDTTGGPKCWISEGNRHKHRDLDVIGGLSNSCNYFFYTVASRLGPDGEALYDYAAKLGLTSLTNVQLPGEEKSVVGSQSTLYDPNKPINGYDQGTWYPVQIRARLREHLTEQGEVEGITYNVERLDTCIKALMDMAVLTDAGTKQQTWIQAARTILMEELGMSQEMVFKAAVMSPIIFYLNEIKWGGSYTIQTAIGQGTSLITPITMARYIAAIANGGYVYDVQLIDSIISPTGEVLQSFTEPTLVHDLHEEVAPYIDYIHQGMFGVVDDESGTARSMFENWTYKDQIAGKTGTAETSEVDIESNSWFVAFAPYENPEIAVVVYVPHGLSGSMSAEAAREVIEYYLDNKEDDVELVLSGPNQLAQ